MLKQLRYAKQLEMKRSKLNELITREQEYKQKAEELEAAINEAETEEDIVDLSQDSGHIKVKFLFCSNHHLWSVPHPE